MPIDGPSTGNGHDDYAVLHERVIALETRLVAHEEDCEEARKGHSLGQTGVEFRIQELAALTQKAIDESTWAGGKAAAAKDLAREARDVAVQARDAANGAKHAAEKGAEEIAGQIGAILGELGGVRKLLGSWPASPDDTGSGLAGQLARHRASGADLEMHLARARQLAPEAPLTPKSSLPPPEVVSLWKRTRNRRHLAAGLAAALVSLAGVIWTVVQVILQAAGKH